jgi:transposase
MDTSTHANKGVSAIDTLGRRVAWRGHRTIEEKQRIVAESFAPGASVAEVARRYEVNANQVFAWRRLQQQGLLAQRSRRATGRKLVPVTLLEAVIPTVPVTTSMPSPTVTAADTLTIELPGGARLTVSGAIDATLLAQALHVLR